MKKLLLITLMFFSSICFANDGVPLFEKAAELGDIDAQTALGAMYYYGDGARQDYVKAKKWLEKAAEQGDSLSQYVLGTMYRDGKGVLQDEAKAKEWLEKACNNADHPRWSMSSILT